jgi:hypothetical protein
MQLIQSKSFTVQLKTRNPPSVGTIWDLIKRMASILEKIVLFCTGMPWMSAQKAFSFMDTNNPAAFMTHPLLLFLSDKMPYAKLSYDIEILNHTHAILGLIADIQVTQFLAGEAVA